MSATCPSCGAPVEETGDRCPRCGQGTTRRYSVSGGPSRFGSPPPPEITLPCLVPEARFTVADAWTHGLLYLTDLGLYLLAEPDGPWTPDRLLTLAVPDPSKPHPVAPSSQFLPLNRIERFQHSRFTSYAIVTPDGKRPLRLTSDGWKMIDAFAARLGIPTT